MKRGTPMNAEARRMVRLAKQDAEPHPEHWVKVSKSIIERMQLHATPRAGRFASYSAWIARALARPHGARFDFHHGLLTRPVLLGAAVACAWVTGVSVPPPAQIPRGTASVLSTNVSTVAIVETAAEPAMPTSRDAPATASATPTPIHLSKAPAVLPSRVAPLVGIPLTHRAASEPRLFGGPATSRLDSAAKAAEVTSAPPAVREATAVVSVQAAISVRPASASPVQEVPGVARHRATSGARLARSGQGQPAFSPNPGYRFPVVSEHREFPVVEVRYW